MDTTILNRGLDFALEFGANWLQPTQERLREAMTFGHGHLVECWRAAYFQQERAYLLFQDAVLVRYSWVSEENLTHLFSQSCYYAFKNGEI